MKVQLTVLIIGQQQKQGETCKCSCIYTHTSTCSYREFQTSTRSYREFQTSTSTNSLQTQLTQEVHVIQWNLANLDL